jgi:hypothetical protein
MMARETGAFTEAWPVHSGFSEFRGNAQDDPSLRSAAIALSRNENTYHLVSYSILDSPAAALDWRPFAAHAKPAASHRH